MMLTVDVLPLLPLHRVRVRVEVEGAWTLTGRAEGRTWQVAEGVGAAWLSDPWAPLGLAITYTLTTDAGPFAAGPGAPPHHRSAALPALQGQRVVGFLREPAPRSHQPRHTPRDAPGVRRARTMS